MTVQSESGDVVPPAYPAHWEADAVLADGGTVHLRPITPDDADRLREFHSRLSPETVYNRFFSMVRTLPARDVERFTQVDHDERAAVIALLRDQIVGVTRYFRFAGTADAEVAVVVEDAHQGRGLGALLLEHLESAARERGVERFIADVLPGNRAMLAVFRAAGFEITREMADGYIELAFSIQETPASLEVVRSREHRAEAQSVARLLNPKAVAVVGASREPGTAGHEVFRSLLAHRFEGPVYPVNPLAPHVLSVRAYADVRDVPDDVDLAIVAVPAVQVAEVVKACSEKNVRGLVVVSGGFADGGDLGRARLAEVVDLARDGGMRLIGPNAMGVVNTDPAVSLQATFAPGSAPHGRVGVFTQSGALASTFLAESHRRALGLSTFVSIGDRADVSGNDLLQYWQADPRTDVVMMHLQGFGNPRKFARISRLLGRTKPVVCLKSGRGAGDTAVDALFASAGVIRVDTLAQLFETAQLLALQPLPQGRRVGIVGTSSALASMAADACRAAGLEVPELTDDVRAQLRALAGTTETANPVDLGLLTGVEQLRTALRLVADSGQVDAVLALITPHPEDVALGETVREVSVGGVLPLLASYLGWDGVPDVLAVHDGPGAPVRGSVPSYASPEAAALALSRAAAYAAWRARPQGEVPALDRIDAELARASAATHPPDGTWLAPADSAAVLSAVGVTVWEVVSVVTLDDAMQAAEHVGWPVVLKSGDAKWRNRTDVGAVQLGLDGPADLTVAWQALRALVGDGEVVVQRMAPPGVSTVVRLVSDPAAGPLISLRLGGVAADLLADPLTRTLPLTDLDAADLVRQIRGSSLLLGFDTAALEQVLLRVARLAEEVPSVGEVRLDPVLVGAVGVSVLHGRVRLVARGVDPERGPRRLLSGRGAQHLR